MGVCRLPPEANGSGIHRRIDIRMIPRESWACALLYFTGSDHFNRHRPTYHFSLSLSSNRWSLQVDAAVGAEEWAEPEREGPPPAVPLLLQHCLPWCPAAILIIWAPQVHRRDQRGARSRSADRGRRVQVRAHISRLLLDIIAKGMPAYSGARAHQLDSHFRALGLEYKAPHERDV
jgi:hypothetical protein